MVNVLQKIFLWKRFSSFTYLNISQLLITLNDSIFRLLVAFSLIDLLGTSQSSHILMISGILFVIPLLLFSMPSGELADKIPKQKLIFYTMLAEVAGMIYGIFAMHYEDVFSAYAALFCVAAQAAVFNPAKYAIIPEIVPKDKISRVNGILTLSTYLAIIVGTFLVSFFSQLTGRNYTLIAIFCTFIALLATYTSLQIEPTKAINPEKKINPLFLIQIYKSLKLASKYPHLLLTVIASAYFLFTASFTQLNLIPYGIQALNITDVQTGYVFLAAALGIGIGSLIVAIISGKNVELGISIWGAFGTMISYFLLYVVTHNIPFAVFMIFSLGVHGGLYIVPLDAYIQMESPEKDRGAIVAASAFLGFVGVFFAAVCLGLFSEVLQLSAREGFLIISGLTLLTAMVVTVLLPDYLTRLFAIIFSRSFFQINTYENFKANTFEGHIVVCRAYRLAKAISLMQLFPKISYVKLYYSPPGTLKKILFKLLHIIPICESNLRQGFDQVQAEINQNRIVCIFLEGVTPKKMTLSRQEILNRLLASVSCKLTTVNLFKKKAPASNSFFHIFKLLPLDIQASFQQNLPHKNYDDIYKSFSNGHNNL
jgi:acyl-[acyl-carrier-protein]-phospholipid O-acyltransferase/long-chain-fatty-acid--[acyl-carrier-protein] ligase